MSLSPKREKAGEIYNIPAGSGMTNLQVVETIISLLNKPKYLIEFVEDRPGHDVKYSLDS
ncbi:MAG: hypothetical protein QXP38_11410 [Nitrososphaerota archaeon]